MDATIKITLVEEQFPLISALISKVIALTKLVNVDVQINPVKSSQEVMRKVPGLIIGHHPGGGEAEQIFLRGFNMNGTNVAMDAMVSLNLPSHAHSQGYPDLHFLIPETIGSLSILVKVSIMPIKNFDTAGYIDFNIKDKIDNNSITVEAGEFDTLRAVGFIKSIRRGISQRLYCF